MRLDRKPFTSKNYLTAMGDSSECRRVAWSFVQDVVLRIFWTQEIGRTQGICDVKS
jgi:hypothetical protein